jgi:hypothetical protein
MEEREGVNSFAIVRDRKGGVHKPHPVKDGAVELLHTTGTHTNLFFTLTLKPFLNKISFDSTK